ncbi:glycoprotein [Achromobacter marplatensis]|uniref:Glycoprotein n=1 Tax=Achromobacter marplatensis TaxID=470868 RepID=A0ABX9FW96_9BURK|nr:DUF6246 family protein [Achromobacter marplatensis]OWT55579.1 glycoprotein [Achromobacter marplatensis]RBP11260.1 hypothetical protein DFP87_12321 [Achromobacter marplatensis]CAB3712391.1 hypothetical protein LMG26219_06002 [Achromobacter marplatensis]
MILTEIGEVGVYAGDQVVRLRPSLYAMSRLGDPVEIVETFATVMGGAEDEAQARRLFQAALGVIYACASEDVDPSSLFGTYETTSGSLEYVPGAAPVEHVVPLARCLLKHGVTGALPPLPRRPGDDEPVYVKEFVAREHVAMAMAHLGVSERDAWDLTMTGMVGALRAKFPPAESNAPGAKAPTKEQHDATMAWFDKIEAKRKAAKGVQ